MKSAQATIVLTALILGMMALPASASDDVLGKWEATVETRRGNNDIVMEFTKSDGKLAGTFTARRGTEQLEDIAYADGKLTFTRNTEFQGNAITLNYSATVDGDTLKVTVSTPRGERSFTAKRAS